jgi:hypothetical protein
MSTSSSQSHTVNATAFVTTVIMHSNGIANSAALGGNARIAAGHWQGRSDRFAKARQA